jgi:hypothetical protein
LFNFSIWKFNGVNNIEDVKEKIKSKTIKEEYIGWDDSPLKIAFGKSSTEDSFNDIKSVYIEGSEVKYILFGSVVEKLKYAKEPNKWFLSDNATLKPREDRVKILTSDVLLFEKDNEIYGILFSGITVAKQIIVNAFPVDIWGKICRLDLNIKEDILFWMFKSFIDFDSKELSDKIPIRITAIRSYLAKTRDEINTLRGKGEKISAILGTLAFLFKNDKLKSIMPEIQYKGEVFVVEISLNGTFRTDDSEYEGNFLELDKTKKKISIVIYLATILLPKIVEAYNENVKTQKWSNNLKLVFIEKLGGLIKDSVDAELENMKKNKIKEINLIDEIENNYIEIKEETDEGIDEEIEEIDYEINNIEESN